MRIIIPFSVIYVAILLTTTFCGSDQNNKLIEIAESDRRALIDLYYATDGENWINNDGWLDENSDSWYGVKVNAEGRVVRVDLFQNGLSGSLPASIGNLTKVTYFNVKQNKLSGAIPPEIGDMSSLEWLILAGNPSFDGQATREPPQDLTQSYHQGKSNDATNDFSGDIPSTIGQLAHLKRLELSGTSITSLPEEIGNCTSLEGLYINWSSELNQELPSTIGNLTRLRHLYMAEDQLNGDIPASMSNLTNLTFLELGSLNGDRNQLTGELPDFSGSTKLRYIGLDQNNISGEWPDYWNNGNFPFLEGIRATWNNFTGTLHGFENLDLLVFDIDGNNLEGTIPKSIVSNNRLIILGLGWNNFTGQIPQKGWGSHDQTRYLRFAENKLAGPIPGELPNSPDLQYLYFEDNHLSGAISLNHAKYADDDKYPDFHYMDISNNVFRVLDYQPLLSKLGRSKLIVE